MDEPSKLAAQHQLSDDALLFEELKETLLHEDREALRELQNILNQPEKLSQKMSPVLEKRLEDFKEAFPNDYRAILEKIISEKLANSKEELLEAIYPIMGKLIKKYIALQFDLLRERMAMRNQNSIWYKTKTRIRAFFTGTKESDIILTDLMDVEIKNVFVIQKNSGLLIAAAINDAELHTDLVAGMMTAIKSFAEDAFDRKGAELEVITYDNYQLLLENYYSYYFVVALTGTISSHQDALIHEKMNNFAARHLNRKKVKDGQFSEAISKKLKDYFIDNPKV